MCSKLIQLYIHMCVCVYIYVYIYFQVLLYYRLLHDTEYSSLHYIVGLCCLSSLYVVVCSSQTPNLSLPFGNHNFVVHVYQSVSVM